MASRIFRKLLLVLVVLSSLPVNAQLPQSYTVFEVDANLLRMRDQPGQDGQIIRNLPRGTSVLIVKREGAWARIYVNGDPSFGWVHGDYLKGPEDAD